jgi:outer membrane lipoprotein LolB
VTRRLAALALLSLAAGCTTVAPPAPVGERAAQEAELQSLEAWSLDGRIAVAAGDDGFSGGFDWVQAGERADISIQGPMGGAAFAIHVEGGKLTLNARGETYADDEARAIIGDRIGNGTMLPVGEMRYWLIGVPAPGVRHEEARDADRRLAELGQSGWRVRYERYGTVGAYELPTRVEMSTEGLRLRVVVSDWRMP